MSLWSRTTRSVDARAGFTLLELLAVMLVGTILLGGFTAFYIGQQRAARRNEIEIETSQALRAAIEQIGRDLRIVGRDLTRGLLSAGINRFTTAGSSEIDFYIDGADQGVVAGVSPQRKRYRYNSNTIEQCTCNGNSCTTTCSALADFAGTLSLNFRYKDCGGTDLGTPPLSAANRNKIGRIDVKVNLFRGLIGGTNINRTEVDSITLRNLCN